MAITPLPQSETDIRNLIINNLKTSTTITAVEHRAVENALVDAVFYTPLGDIKEVACTVAYINDNFDMNPSLPSLPGKGKVGSERYGWAICNGNNGTIDKRGRVGIGYDGNTYQMGGIGGASTVTLSSSQIPSHGHEYQDAYYAEHSSGGSPNSVYGQNSNSDNDNSFVYRYENPVGASFAPPGVGRRPKTYDNTGGDQSHNNMQPYVVSLFIQKISTPY